MTSEGARRRGRSGLLRIRQGAALALLAALAGGCALNFGTVVLLPEKEARGAAIGVRQGDREILLDQPYAASRQTTFGPQAYTSNPQEVAQLFGAALAAQPARPVAYTLHFIEGADEFTDESKRILETVLSDIAGHPVPDVVVVGHTDSVGSDEINDALALRRAETVRTALIRRGLAPASIAATGRGKRELLVPTADGVAEPRNRRVEIIVR